MFEPFSGLSSNYNDDQNWLLTACHCPRDDVRFASCVINGSTYVGLLLECPHVSSTASQDAGEECQHNLQHFLGLLCRQSHTMDGVCVAETRTMSKQRQKCFVGDKSRRGASVGLMTTTSRPQLTLGSDKGTSASVARLALC